MEGLWTIEFGSTTGDFGAGTVVFHDGKVQGGDSSYYYDGTFKMDGDSFTAQVDVRPFIFGGISVFGTIGKDISLSISGKLVDNKNAIAQGSLSVVPQHKLGIKLIKRD